MAGAAKLTTTVSTKGQVILPKAIRQRREWAAGTRLVVEETPDGVLLKRAPAFAATRPEEVFGLLPHTRKARVAGGDGGRGARRGARPSCWRLIRISSSAT